VVRERLVLRRAGFAALLRVAFAATPVAGFAVERFAGALRAVDVRVAPVLAAFARVERLAVERFAVDLRAVDLRAVDLRAVERFAAGLRADVDDAVEPEEVEAEPSIDHLPDITRCAASATASAISEPSFVALVATALAACDAVSAASSPASRIFLRAAGLAAIAAAAAVSPAASISLLIAALASLSILSLERELDELERELEELERAEVLRGDFAICCLPRSRERHFTAVPVPE
jgi:hypothetical protein